GGEGELDVLAGAERVRGEVGAGAVVVAQAGAADVDAVGTLALRVGHLELGEDAVFAEVLQGEVLLAAELAAQLDLPVLQRHALRLVQPRQLGGLARLAVGFGGLGPAATALGRSGGGAGAAGGRGRLLPPLHEEGLRYLYGVT